MPDEAIDAPPRPILTSVAAQLFVGDIKASCEFFTAKLRAARHLPAYAADLSQRFVQFVHGQLTLQCKVNCPRNIVNSQKSLPHRGLQHCDIPVS